MLPQVTPIKELQSQPLVRNVMKHQFRSQMTMKPIKSSNILNITCKSAYQQYRKQHNQPEEIQIQTLFFRNRESSSRDTPPSFLITKHQESRIPIKESKIEETKYQEKIEFQGRKLQLNQDNIDTNLLKSFQRFRLQENVCQRQIITSQRIKRSSGVSDLEKNKFFLNKQSTGTTQSNWTSQKIQQSSKQNKKIDYSSQIDGIINTLVHQNYQSMDDELEIEKVSEEIEIKENYLSSKELKSCYKEIKRNRNFKPIINKMFEPKNIIKQKNYIQEYMNDEYIIQNPKIEKLEQVEGWYDQELKKITFKPEGKDEDLNAVHIDQVGSIGSERQIQNQITQAAELLEPLLYKYLKIKKIHNENQEQDEGPEVNFGEEEIKIEKVDHLQKNIKELITNKGSLHKLLNINRELFIQGIPNILTETNFSRYELHNTYILYCALQQITSQRYRYYNIDDGVDYDTYRTGIYQIFMQSEYLAKKIFDKIDFNFSGFLNWDEFLKLMVSIRAKTLVEKLDLFIQISDQDGNGQLSYDEILSLSKECLSKYISNSDEFLDMLCEYYTRLIFKVVGKELDEEIPFSAIKDAIFEQKEDSDLLCMFCGADI